MTFFDLSQPLFDECPNCPVHPPVRLPRSADHPEDGWRMEEFHMASHSGTHLDAPLHKLAGGKSIDQFPLEAFCGSVSVADLTGQVVPDQAIGAVALEQALGEPGLLENKVGDTSAPRRTNGCGTRPSSIPRAQRGLWHKRSKEWESTIFPSAACVRLRTSARTRFSWGKGSGWWRSSAFAKGGERRPTMAFFKRCLCFCQDSPVHPAGPSW